jgi:RNA polymerase sigma-70 factor (ECF subfamily)
MDRTNDRQLIRRLQTGDEEAVKELADRYSHRIFQMALRHMKNREDAEEVTQDVLLKVYRKIDKFRGDAALSSWIYRITFNTAMSRLRTHRAERAAEASATARFASGQRTEAPTPRQPADWSHMPDEELMRRQLREACASALRSCPRSTASRCAQGHRRAVTEEASTRLRVKDQTLKSRLHRGRVMLRKQLERLRQAWNCTDRRPERSIVATPFPRVVRSRARRVQFSVSERRTRDGRSRSGEPGGNFQRKRCHPADAAGVDLLPVVARRW